MFQGPGITCRGAARAGFGPEEIILGAIEQHQGAVKLHRGPTELDPGTAGADRGTV